MKTFAFIFILSISSTFALSPEQIEAIQVYETDCLKEIGYDYAALENAKQKGMDGVAAEMRCFSSCILQKFGFLSEKGVFQESNFREFETAIPTAKLDTMIADCKNEIVDDICDTANRLVYCFAKYEKLF